MPVRSNEPWRRLYPFKRRYLDLGGIRYHYLDEGSGPPVLMVHGNPTWSFYYRELVKALRDDFRCIVPDHVGCGLSDKPDDARYAYTLDRRVQDLEVLLDHLKLEDDLTLVVHDWGGMIGLAAALRRPRPPARLVIMNTSGFLIPAAKRLPRRLALLRRGGPLAEFAVLRLNAFARGAARMAAKRRLLSAVRAGYLAPYDSPANRIATLRFVQDIPLVPGDPAYATARWVDENLHRLGEIPTLICWGARDFVFDRHFLAEWRRRFPEVEVHVIESAGHYVLEDAATELVSIIREFLHRPASQRNDTAVNKSPRQACRGFESPSIPSVTTINVAQHLRDIARRHPETRALVWTRGTTAHGAADYTHLTFSELDRMTDRCARGLVRIGVTRGMRTIVMVRPNVDFFVLTFALYKLGAVPILVDPGMGRRKMVECLQQVDAQAFIGIPLAHLLRITHPSAFRTCHILVTTARAAAFMPRGATTLAHLCGGPNEPFEIAPTRPDDPAAIIFTTGSTGPPKGVLFQHGTFDAQVRALRDHFGIAPGEIDLPTFPLFALFDPALGMTAVLPDMDPPRPALVDPVKIIRAVHDQKVTHMFGSPALLDRVSRYGEAHGITLPTVRRVISAGAPVSPAVLRRFAAMLPPDARIHTPYGATEALPVCSIDHAEVLGETAAMTALGKGTCVGRPVGEAVVRIIRISDAPIDAWSDDLPLPRGEIGEVAVKGPMVTRRYVTDERANRLHKIRDADGDVWHRMGDVGYVDEKGRLWFCGRKSHRVVTEDGVLYTEQWEGIFNTISGVRRTALVGVGSPLRQRPVLCVELEVGSPLRDSARLEAALREVAGAHSVLRMFDRWLVHPGFPVDIRHNAKIFREKLAEWAEAALA